MAVLARLANFVAKQISTPAAPPAGSNVLYPKADDNFYTLDSSGDEEQLVGVKTVRCVTTNEITLSGIPSSGVTDGVTVANGDRVLVRCQGYTLALAKDNGIYVVNSAGAWTRASDHNTAAEVALSRVVATEGTKYAGVLFTTKFKTTNVLGTDNVSYNSVAFENGDQYNYPNPVDGGAYFEYSAGDPARLLRIVAAGAWRYIKGVQDYTATAPTNPAIGEIWLDTTATTASATALPFFKGVPVSRSQAITAGQNIPFTATEDTHSGWYAGGNYYFIPIPGLYRVTAQVKIDSTNTVVSIAITNSSGTVLAWAPNQSGTGGYAGSQITDVFRFAANDTVAVRPQTTDALQNDATENTFLIIEYVRP